MSVPGRPGVTRRLAGYFLRGLALSVPVAVTLYVAWWVLATVDRWIPVPIPGLGVVIVAALITLIGALGSTLITRGIVTLLDAGLERLPFVRLVYGATKDLLEAFVGERRRFNRAVTVAISADGAVRAMGFVTRDDLEALGLPGHVAVYLPSAYSFAGHVVVVPADRVTPLPVDGAKAMAFIVSGGVSDG